MAAAPDATITLTARAGDRVVTATLAWDPATGAGLTIATDGPATLTLTTATGGVHVLAGTGGPVPLPAGVTARADVATATLTA